MAGFACESMRLGRTEVASDRGPDGSNESEVLGAERRDRGELREAYFAPTAVENPLESPPLKTEPSLPRYSRNRHWAPLRCHQEGMSRWQRRIAGGRAQNQSGLARRLVSERFQLRARGARCGRRQVLAREGCNGDCITHDGYRMGSTPLDLSPFHCANTQYVLYEHMFANQKYPCRRLIGHSQHATPNTTAVVLAWSGK